jgi:type I restriction enzyme, S subunit
MTEMTTIKNRARTNISGLIAQDGIFCDGDWVESKDQNPSGKVRLIQLADIGDGFFKDKSNRFLTKERAEALNCTFLSKNDLLVARLPDPLGRACLFPLSEEKSYVTAVDVCVIRPNTRGVNSRYLLYLINSPWIRAEIEKYKSGTTRKRISRKNLDKILLPIASLSEQEQLVSVVDQLFSDLDNAIDNFKKAKDQLKVYRQSVLKYALEGKYSKYKETWKTDPLGEICKVVSGNTPKGVNDIFADGDIPFYKVADMNTEGNELFMRKAKINLSTGDCKKLKLKTFPKGTVVFPKRGGAILTNKKRILSKESAFDLNLMGVIPGANVRERFLFDWFLALDLGTLCDGSNVPQINHSDIEPLKFPQVSIEIQDDVIKEIESRLSVCDKMEETINNSLEQAEALRQSILKQAFEGKLTEEWCKKHPDLVSGENSAKALLDRIKKERGALKNTKKRKK